MCGDSDHNRRRCPLISQVSTQHQHVLDVLSSITEQSVSIFVLHYLYFYATYYYFKSTYFILVLFCALYYFKTILLKNIGLQPAT